MPYIPPVRTDVLPSTIKPNDWAYSWIAALASANVLPAITTFDLSTRTTRWLVLSGVTAQGSASVIAVSVLATIGRYWPNPLP